MSKLVLGSLIGLSLLGCSKKPEPQGACVVDYDDLGLKGTACSVDTEAKCKSGDLITMRPGGFAELKMKSFEPGKTCKDVGYARGGCADIAIAWSFSGKCPL